MGASLRKDNLGARLEVGGAEGKEWQSLHRLQQSLGIRRSWASEECFWGFFTTAWAGLPLSERAHDFGLCAGAYEHNDVAPKLTCSCHGQFRHCPHPDMIENIKSFKARSLSWAMQVFLDLQPPISPHNSGE